MITYKVIKSLSDNVQLVKLDQKDLLQCLIQLEFHNIEDLNMYIKKLILFDKIKSNNLIQILQHEIQNLSVLVFLEDFSEFNSLDTIVQLFKQSNMYFEENQILSMMYNLISPITMIHSLQLTHRQISPINIFFDKNFNVKLGIFELHNSSKQKSIYDSPEYLSHKQYTKKSDIFAIGCVLYYMSTFQIPFPVTDKTIINGILFSSIKPIPNFYSTNIVKLIRQLLNREGKARPDSLKLLNNQILSGVPFQDSLNGIKQTFMKLEYQTGKQIEITIDNIKLEEMLKYLYGNEVAIEVRIETIEKQLKFLLNDNYLIIYNDLKEKINKFEALWLHYIDENIQDLLIQLIQNIISFRL